MRTEKMCNTEVMKLIKSLNSQKNDLIAFECRNSFVKYTIDEKDMADKTPYDINGINAEITEIDNNIRYLKHLLNISNATTIVKEFGMTIGEALVYMVQLTQSIQRYQTLANMDKIVREMNRYGQGQAEYKEAKYDIAVAKELLDTSKATLMKLQMAIDRTNLTNEIEVVFTN